MQKSFVYSSVTSKQQNIMRTQRNNFIPLPTKPARSIPKPLLRPLGSRKSSSSQTERVVLVKEENISFYPCTRLGHNDGGMRRDYVKAVNYINSCHKFINAIIEKNSLDKSNVFLLPMITNFSPLFPYLVSKKTNKKEKKRSEDPKKSSETKARSQCDKITDERKSKSYFAVKKRAPEEMVSVDVVPAGDGEKVVTEQPLLNENIYSGHVSDIVKEQIYNFLFSLQNDIHKATKKNEMESKNSGLVKQKLQELSKMCGTQNNVDKLLHSQPSICTPSKERSEDCSIIFSDTDCEEHKLLKKNKSQPLKITHYYQESVSSLISESSDIKSDSDMEINNKT